MNLHELSLRGKLGLTAAAVVVGAGITFAFFKLKYRTRNAVNALKYLIIETVTNEELCDQIVKELQSRISNYRAIGFDCEWVVENGKRHPVALLQLSTFDGFCGLFRINQLNGIPDSLKDLLEDQTIYKVGVAPYDDAKYLTIDYGVQTRSTIDIRHLAKLCGHTTGGLAALSKAELKIILDKSWRVRCSDWEADNLTTKQIKYAAADAHVAIMIFVKLINELIYPTLLKRLFAKYNVWKNLDDVCWKYVDVSFKQNAEVKNKPSKGVKGSITSKPYPHPTRSKPLYNNCFLEAPDGELLCTCDKKKALWYVEKELADVVSEEPLAVRLRFEPAGRSVGDVGRYYQLAKENKCVVCGATNSYIRKNVVPREYRKYFPEIMKEHSSHDVVLLCVNCHRRSNAIDQPVRERLADICKAPLANGSKKFIEDNICRKIRSAARTLLRQCDKVPENKKKEMKETVLQYFPQHDEITEELLLHASNIRVLYENSEYESHGLKVVEHFLKQDGGLLKLEEMWREHFLTTMRPKYMPQLWSIKHNEERLLVRFNEGRLSEEDIKQMGMSRWL